MALIGAAFFVKRPRWQLVLVTSALSYWLFKLLFLKGDYAVGFGGTPDLLVVGYDLTAALARCLLWSQLLGYRNFGWKNALLVATVVVVVKLLFFQLPLGMDI